MFSKRPAIGRGWVQLVTGLLSVFSLWAGATPAGLPTGRGAPQFEKMLETGAFLTGAILQDKDGFLWFGSQGSGLYRFDGMNTVVFQAGQGSLSDDNVLALAEGRDDCLWIATTRGLTLYDKRAGSFRVFLHDPANPNGISGNSFNVAGQTLLEDRTGTVWIGLSNGLNRYNRATGSFQRVRSGPAGPVSDSVFALLEDRLGRLWVGTDKGLSRCDARRQTFVNYRHDPADERSLSPGTVTALLETSRGEIWVGTDNGLDRFDEQTGRFTRYSKSGRNLPDDYVYALHEGPAGRIWVGHNMKGGGLTLLDPATGAFTSYGPGAGEERHLSSDSIAGFCRDRSGITWLVHMNGSLDAWDPHVNRITSYRHDPADPSTISDRMANTSYVDRAGVVWFAAPNGLNRFDRATGRFTRYLHDPKNPRAIPGGFVCGPLEDSQGNFWVLSDTFLSLFDRTRGETTVSYKTFRSPISVIEDRTRPDRLWLCSWGEGLACFDKRTRSFTYFRHDPKNPASLSNDLLVTLCQMPDGLIWVPTMGGGLDVFDPAAGKVVRRFRHNPADPASLGSDTVPHVLRDSRGVIWVATYGGGLNRLDPSSGQFRRYDKAAGFPTNTVTNILEDNDGNLWLGSKIGFIRFTPATGQARVYTTDDGLAGNQFQEAALAKSSDGTIWVATITGASSFRPRDLADNPYVPPIVVTAFKQSGDPMALNMAPEKVRTLTLDWRHNFFEFEFAALSYTRPQMNRFKYKLEGLDTDWFDSATRRFGRYSNLPDGTYTLRIIGSNNDGVWNKEGVSVQVIVTPPFWRTTWFRLLAGTFVLLSIGTVVGARIRRVRRHRQALERDLAERKRNEAILRESEARFRSLVANVPGVIYRADFDGNRHLQYLSPGFAELTGADADEFLSNERKPIEDLIHPEDRCAARQTVREAVSRKSPYAAEYRINRKGSGERWIQDRGRGEYGPDGELLWLDGALFDITEKRLLESQLLQTQKMESIGRLAGGIAHDLNSLLTVVIGHAELAAADLADRAPLREGLLQIQEAGQRAAQLTGQLLMFARRAVLQPRLVDLNALVFGLDRILRRLIGSDIELVILPGDGIWPVKADPNQLEQVILNLAINARDAMPGGGRLAIRTGNVTPGETAPKVHASAGEGVLVEVSDTGEGMTEEVRHHVFEPFFTTKAQGKGTGLGLSSCYGIVQQAGGEITVESAPGCGSTFRVFLPRAEGELPVPAAEEAGELATGGDETILLAEDEPLMREFVAHALGLAGYRVLPAADGEEALRLAESAESPIHLLLTDVVMPRMGGRELVREFRKRGFRAAVLYMSGYDSASVAGGIPTDGLGWLPKPFSARELTRRAREVLDRWRAETGEKDEA